MSFETASKLPHSTAPFGRGRVLGRIMKTLILLIGIGFFLLAAVNGSTQHKKRLTLEAIFGGELNEPAPTELCWAPDGRHLSYFLPESGDERALWVLDIATGKKTQILSPLQAQEMAPSPEQASISERERTRRNRYEIRSYSWSPEGKPDSSDQRRATPSLLATPARSSPGTFEIEPSRCKILAGRQVDLFCPQA